MFKEKRIPLGTDDVRDDPKLDDNGAFRKTPALRLSVDRKHLENGAFENVDIMITRKYCMRQALVGIEGNCATKRMKIL